MPAPLVSALTYLLAPRIARGAADDLTNARLQSLIDQGKAQGQTYDEMVAAMGRDPYLNALRMVPGQSGLENAVDIARAFYNGNPYGMRREDIPAGDLSTPDARTVGELLAGQGFNDPNVQPGAYVTRENPYTEQVQFLTPMDDFLSYGGRDDDAGGRSYQEQSYGQTEQPATEVRFDGPVNPPDVLADRDAAMDYGYAYPHANPYVQRGEQFLAPMEDFLRYGGRDDDENRQFQAQSYGQTDQPATQVSYGGGGGANGGLAALIRRRRA